MDQHTLAPDLFRSRLIPCGAICYTLAALCGTVGIVLLFSPGYTEAWHQEMILSGITSGLAAWRLIHIAVTLFSCLCPVIMAAGMWLTMGKETIPGMKLISNMAQYLLHGTTITGILALLYLIFRLVRFVIYCATRNEGLYLLYTTLFPESLMVLQAWFLWKKLREFLEALGDSAASITYTLTSGKLDSLPTPSFTATGLFILSVFNIVLAVDQIFTITIVYNYPNAYYKLLAASHFGQYFACATLLFGATANILMALFLRRYNRLHERALYYARKQKS